MSTSQDSSAGIPTNLPRQTGVLAYRRTERGPEILLVTSSTRKRWIIPKGNIEPHLNEIESARREAFEEAGVHGSVRSVALGSYIHASSGGPTRVRVYLMEVERILARWPEAERRERAWMTVREAHDRILEPGLRDILLAFNEEIT